MKCSEIREFIYTYAELCEAKKRFVDDHIAGCASCRKLIAEARETQVLIKRSAVFSPEPAHAAKLTANIMKSITGQPKPYRQSRMGLDAPLFRYMMAACSLLLIVMFVAQQRIPETRYKPAHRTQSVLLNSSSMLRELREKVSRKEESDSWYVCVRQEHCDLTIFQTVKIKNLQ